MNDDIDIKVRQLVTETLQPVFETLIDTCLHFYKHMRDSMPPNMPDTEKQRIVTELINAQRDGLVAGIKAGVPDDLDIKLREASTDAE